MSKNINPIESSSHYYPPELMQFIYCSAVFGIVLKENNKAKKIYDEVLDCLKLPGCQDLFDKLYSEIPEGEKLIRNLIKKSGYDYKNPPDMKELGIPSTRNVISGVDKFTSEYQNKLTPWVINSKRPNRDLKILIGKINELIKIGFNNEKEQSKGRFRITAYTSNSLLQTIMFVAYNKSSNFLGSGWENLKTFEIGGKEQSISDIVYDSGSSYFITNHHRDVCPFMRPFLQLNNVVK